MAHALGIVTRDLELQDLPAVERAIRPPGTLFIGEE